MPLVTVDQGYLRLLDSVRFKEGEDLVTSSATFMNKLETFEKTIKHLLDEMNRNKQSLEKEKDMCRGLQLMERLEREKRDLKKWRVEQYIKSKEQVLSNYEHKIKHVNLTASRKMTALGKLIS